MRQRLSKDYLSSTGLSAQEIAELLGFTEASNFRRAFKSWSGLTPDEFRAAPDETHSLSVHHVNPLRT